MSANAITGAPSLESLSEAAAKGRLEIGAFDVDGFGVPLTAVHDEASVGGTLPEGLVAVATLLYTEYPIDHHDARPERAEANAAYLGGLWNEHRAGRLHTDEALAQAVAAAREETGWQPIETAPRDGRMIGVPGGCAYWSPRMERWAAGVGASYGRPIEWPVTVWKSLDPPTPAQTDTAPGGRADG